MKQQVTDKQMKTGIIGLGAMGTGMALNLHQAGYLSSMWNRTPARAESLVRDTGIKLADSIATLALECELIITCVSRDNDVIEVVTAIAAAIQPGSIVIDTSTVSNKTACRAAAILEEKQAHFLDGPVSGGVEGARNGTLAMMVGGDESVLDRARASLGAITSRLVHIGPCGSGQACKAVNQVMVAGINQAVTEALAFAEDIDLDTNKVINVISTGAAGNWFLDHRGKTMVAGEFSPGFKLNLHHKDLLICKDMATHRNAESMPLTEMTLKHYQKLMQDGFGDEDISALFRLKHDEPG